MIARANDPRKTPFGKQLSQQGVIIEWIAKSRVEIDAARFVVLNAAVMIDELDAKSAMKEIAEAKILIPKMAMDVIDRAIQIYGAEGIGQDTPLAYMWTAQRALRFADGPDEVHLQQLGKRENKRAAEVRAVIQAQEDASMIMLQQYETKDIKSGSTL
jgi:acyl-CoA dehydrogenase